MMDHVAMPGIRLLFTVACMLLFPMVYAEPAEDQAEDFFKQKAYDKALAIWYGMIESDNSSPGIFYNIGLAESQLHNTPKAMLGFEKALRLKPLNKTIKAAIGEERKGIENATVPVEPFFLKEWYKGMITSLRPGYWAFLGLGMLAFSAFSFLNGKVRMKTIEDTRARTQFYIGLLGLFMVAAGFFAYKEIYREDEAIVSEQCEIRLAPANDSPEIRILYPGEKITITDQIGEWYNVQLLNLDAGWIKKECLIPILIGNH